MATVYPVEPFDAIADAALLCDVMRRSRTDEKSIIEVLTNRGIIQRLEIAKVYKTYHGNALISDLKGRVSGNLWNVTAALMTPLPHYYAKELHDALSARATDEEAIIEILCTLSNYGITTITESYEELYGKSLENDLKDNTSGPFERLSVPLCQAKRNETHVIDHAQAKSDAQKLFDTGAKQWSAEDSHFNTIIVTHSYPQLAQTFLEYEHISGDDIEVPVEKAFSGNIKKGVLAIVKCVKSKIGFFTGRLHSAMQGIGTNDRTLIRIVVSRSEIDLGDIKKVFERRYGKSLESWIAGDTSGDYKKTLLSIVSTNSELRIF
ncbi:annexin B9-like [Diachasma alloeum]|uniref:annexin B9-like n=1 Tax=Diachasma alloeum TaxID=454923 RepID=UPI00073837B1|nr:annexin B9-like [Diachasma alloeum]